jgi:hypothetical protein
VAHDLFSQFGMEGFADRAQVELCAIGEHAWKRTVENSNDLTPQEAQISRRVGQGATNREIAAQLFISATTVEYHLHRVFASSESSRGQNWHSGWLALGDTARPWSGESVDGAASSVLDRRLSPDAEWARSLAEHRFSPGGPCGHTPVNSTLRK